MSLLAFPLLWLQLPPRTRPSHDQPLQSHFSTSSMIQRNLWNHPPGRIWHTSCFSYLSACTHIISFVWYSHPTPSPFPPFLRWLSPSYPSNLTEASSESLYRHFFFPAQARFCVIPMLTLLLQHLPITDWSYRIKMFLHLTAPMIKNHVLVFE